MGKNGPFRGPFFFVSGGAPGIQVRMGFYGKWLDYSVDWLDFFLKWLDFYWFPLDFSSKRLELLGFRLDSLYV